MMLPGKLQLACPIGYWEDLKKNAQISPFKRDLAVHFNKFEVPMFAWNCLSVSEEGENVKSLRQQ